MQYLNLHLFLLSVVIVICGCSSKSGSVETIAESPAIHKSFDCQVSDDAWSCLRAACDLVHGVYDARLHSCGCSDGGIFYGWDNPVCKPQEKESSDSVRSYGGPKNITSEINFQINSSKIEAQNSLGTDWQTMMPTFRLMRSVWYDDLSDLESPEILNVLNTYLYLRPADTSTLHDFLSDGNLGGQLVGAFEEHYFVSDFNEINRLLGGTEFSATDLVLPEAMPAELKEGFTLQEGQTTTQSLSHLGCLGSCVETREFSSAESNWRFKVEKLIAGGRIFRRQMLAFPPNAEMPIAAVVQAPSGEPLTYIKETDLDSETRQAEFYLPDGRKIGATKTVLHAEAVRSVRQAKTADVLVCETNLPDQTLSSNALNALVRGPYASETYEKGKSLYGWIQSSNRQQFFSGLTSINEQGFFEFDSGRTFDPATHSSKSHMEEVISALVTGTDLTVAPADPLSCLRHDVKSSEVMIEPKVVNYSTGQEVDSQQCDQMFPELKFMNQLWVLAAGNHGSSDLVELQKICPQSSLPKGKRIIVGALSGDQVAAYSNRGVDFVDIFADGSLCENGTAVCARPGTGTSFASPRVAAIAAKIAKLYPSMDISDVRIAILMGADISTELPCLSRGRLDEEMSLKIAKVIDSQTGKKSGKSVLLNAVSSLWDRKTFKKKALIYNDITRSEIRH